MKEQIEEALKELEFDRNEYTVKGSLKTCQFVLTNKSIKKITNCILALIPNNDWLEYPKHKPSEQRKTYICYTNLGIEAGYWNLEKEFSFNNDLITDSDVIAFKPIPVEPFVKKENEYMKKINNIIYCLSTSLITLTGKQLNDAQEFALELKAKIENGELI